MMRLQTGRRLHFGLFSPKPLPELGLAYGGLGVMVDAPGIVLNARYSDQWNVIGDHTGRVSRIVAILRESDPVLRPLTIELEYLAPVHQGWGTGTQLALAVARLCKYAGKQSWSASETARLLGRGGRSGIGTAGFEQGGLLLDTGQNGESAGKNVLSYSLPSSWTWVLVEPGQQQGLHTDAERQAFRDLPPVDLTIVRELQHLVREQLIPAAAACDFETFAECLTLYNRKAGAHYWSVQHGDYSSAETAERLAIMAEAGALGRGQSSWGPGLFALFPTQQQAESFKNKCTLAGCQLVVANTKHAEPVPVLS